MAQGMCWMNANRGGGMGAANTLNGYALRSLAGLGQTQPDSTAAAQTAGTAPQTPGAGGGFNWEGLIGQGFNFAEKLITLRPAQGTVITRGPGGAIQVARGADGQLVNYAASNTQIGGQFGGQVGAAGQLGIDAMGFNSNVLMVGGVLLIAVVLLSKR